MEDYKYRLEPYKGTSSRYTCPSCGHKGEFTRYINAKSEYISDEVGRCNREKCSYHLTPKQYFAENPDKRPEPTSIASSLHSQTPIVEERPQTFLPNTLLDAIKSCRERNALYKYLCSLFDTREVDKAFDRYKVGTSKHWRKDGYLSAVFPQIDEQGRLCQIKIMAYNAENGKRLHKEHSCEQWNDKAQAYFNAQKTQDRLMFIGKRICGQDAVLHQTFFGAHLIQQDTTYIGIVESEKTALICSILMPHFTWIATGGKCGCSWTSGHNAELLKGKTVVLFADEDGLQEWEHRAEQLRALGIAATCSHICEGKGEHCDIGDLLLAEHIKLQKKKADPTYKRQTIGELCAMLDEIKFPKGRIKINIGRTST